MVEHGDALEHDDAPTRQPGLEAAVEKIGEPGDTFAKTHASFEMELYRAKLPVDLPEGYPRFSSHEHVPPLDGRRSGVGDDSSQTRTVAPSDLTFVEAKAWCAAKNARVAIGKPCTYSATDVLGHEFTAVLQERLGAAGDAGSHAKISVEWGQSADGDIRMRRVWWDVGDQRLELIPAGDDGSSERSQMDQERQVREQLDARYADCPVRSMEAGRKGAWTKELHKPAAKTIYDVDGTIYVTDAYGRVEHVRAQLIYVEPTEAEKRRNGYQQRVAGRGGRLEIDQGGHLIAVSLGGAGEGINVVAMDRRLNASGRHNWYALERKLLEALKADPPANVRLDVQVKYRKRGQKRPRMMIATYSVNGASRRRVFYQ